MVAVAAVAVEKGSDQVANNTSSGICERRSEDELASWLVGWLCGALQIVVGQLFVSRVDITLKFVGTISKESKNVPQLTGLLGCPLPRKGQISACQFNSRLEVARRNSKGRASPPESRIGHNSDY